MRSALLAAICAALCLTSAAAQTQTQPATGQPAVTFKTEVDYVDVDTVVTDAQGRFVTDLKKDDFEIFEDGKPQKVELFSFVDLPVERGDRFVFGGRQVTNDVKTNQASLAGRLYVIVLDDLDVSMFRSATVRRSARQFIERHLGANDVAAVVYTSGRTDAAQEFTSDRSLLIAAVEKFDGRKLRSSTVDKIDAFYQQQERAVMAEAARDPNSAPLPVNSSPLSAGSSLDPSINPNTRGDGYPDRTLDFEDMERGHRALRVLEELKDLADYMSNVHGRRKALVFFSEGIDYPLDDIYGAQSTSEVIRATQDAITAAARGNVSFFGIDPRGLVGMSADVVSLGSIGSASDGVAAANNLSAIRAEIRLSQDSLRALAEETGGFASVGSNDPSTTFERIVRANSTYYVLGYYPPGHPRDGRFHKIDVRVKRPGLRVQARKGYASPRGKTPEERDREERLRAERDAKKGGADNTTAELRAVLNSPMQQAGVGLLVHAAPFKGAAKEHAVALAIEMDSAPFAFERRNNGTMFADNVELSFFSLNEQGKPLHGERRLLDLSFKPETYQRAKQAGLRVNERLSLAPGRYQLRIGLREAGTRAVGTVFYDLDVPDFANDPLSISGMLLTAGTSPIVPTLIGDKLIAADLLPGPATSRRTFGQGDELGLYAEIYDNLRTQNHTVAISTRLLGEDGREVYASRDSHPQQAQPSRTGTSTIGVSRRISLKDVAPGRYLLRVEAQVNAGGKDARTAARETVITVIPVPQAQ